VEFAAAIAKLKAALQEAPREENGVQNSPLP
jgi:hypothetical protein